MVVFWAWLSGCATPGVEVKDQVVPAACGLCVFHVPEAKQCYWAVEIDGRFLPVAGPGAPALDMVAAHQPEGSCQVERKARVDGTVTPDDRFVARSFELLPYDGSGRTGTPNRH